MNKNIIIGIVVLITAAAGFVTVQAISGQQEPQIAIPAASQHGPSDPFLLEEQAEMPQPAENQASEKPQEPSKVVETYPQPSETAAAAQAPQTAPPAAHIPFTNEPVTAGDPQSYVGTVGQCPFYEIAGDKGCVPPPNIECNADWSICKLKEEIQ